MPKTITKTVYTFQELLEGLAAKTIKPAAVDKARAWLIEGATDHDWYRVADEQLIEDSDANDYTFDVNGRRDG